MSPEIAVCARFKQNAWKKELCSNCFRPKEEHPEKPKRVHVDYKPLPEISPAQSILKANGSCDKSRNVSFSKVESEVIGYGGEEYSTDDEEYSDDEYHSECAGDSGDDEELKRLTEANTNLNGKLTVPEIVVSNNNNAPKTAVADRGRVSALVKPTTQNATPPRVTVQPFNGDPPKSLVFNFLKNKELAAAAAVASANAAATAATAAADREVQATARVDETRDAATAVAAATTTPQRGDVQLRKTESTTCRNKPTLTRSSLVANSNEQYLHMRRNSLQPAADEPEQQSAPPTMLQEIPKVKLHPPETVNTAENAAHEDNDVSSARESDADVGGGSGGTGGVTPYKTRSNVPRMGTMHFKLKLAVATSQQKPEPLKPAVGTGSGGGTADSTPESSLTSREMAGEPDGKADSDEPGDPTTTTTTTTTTPAPVVTPVNRSFLHNFKESSPPLRDSTTPPRTPPKKNSIAGNSPPDCPRSIKRQAPKPPPLPPSAVCAAADPLQQVYHSADSSLSDDELRPDDVAVANRKLLAEYCEQMEKGQANRGGDGEQQPRPSSAEVAPVTACVAAAAGTDEAQSSATLPSAAAGKRPVYEKKKYGKAGKVGLKIKKFLRIPSRDSVTATTPHPAPRPKLEIIHPLDMNKSGVEIIHNSADGLFARDSAPKTLVSCTPHHYNPVRPSKPPPPPRSLPPIAKVSPKSSVVVPPPEIIDVADYLDTPKTCDSSTSDETYEPVNFSAPECDHSSPEMARLTSMQYYGSETESEIYPTIQFGDDFGAEDSIRNTRPGHKSLEESYDAVVIANHVALTKILDQATCSGPKVPKELAAFKTKSLEWSSFQVDPTSRLQKSGCSFYNAKWYDVPVVLSVSSDRIELNNVLNNHFTLTKVTEFMARVEKEYSPGAENEEAYVTLWNAHRVEAVESYCKEYNAKYADVTKEAGLILVETVNLLMGLQASDVERYSLDPFVVTRNILGADPTVAVVQLDNQFQDEDTLCDVMLKVLRLLAPTWEMTVCLSQVLRQNKANSLSKCKALLEFWLWGPTGVTVTPDRPQSLKRWLDLERANELHGHVCSRSGELSAKRICYVSFLVVADDGALYSDAWAALADLKTRPPRDPTISKC